MTEAGSPHEPFAEAPASAEAESALILLVPEVEDLVGEIRAAHDPAAAAGVPAHVTINYPFRPGEDDMQATEAQLRRLFAPQPPFQLRFTQVRRFPTVLYLAPDPVEPVLSLVELVAEAFPESPPYLGAFDQIVPHLTVADVDEPFVLDQLERKLTKRLKQRQPVRSQIDAVWMLQNAGEGWHQVEPFPLLGAASQQRI